MPLTKIDAQICELNQLVHNHWQGQQINEN
jgi:hypothetical protein